MVIPTETFKREKVILARKRTSFFSSLALCCTKSTASRGILFLMAMLGCWTEQHHSHGISYAAATKGNCLGKVHSGTRQHSRAGSAAGVWNCSQRELQASQNQPFPKSSPSPHQEIERMSLPQATLCLLCHRLQELASSSSSFPALAISPGIKIKQISVASSSPVLEHFLCCEPRTPAGFCTDAGKEAHVHSKMREEQ